MTKLLQFLFISLCIGPSEVHLPSLDVGGRRVSGSRRVGRFWQTRAPCLPRAISARGKFKDWNML